jgi:superfamily I DNA and/or RNA helicase
VRANKNRNVGFLKDVRRLNVAITRAKHFLFITGNADTLESCDIWKELIDEVKTNGVFIQLEKVGKNDLPSFKKYFV